MMWSWLPCFMSTCTLLNYELPKAMRAVYFTWECPAANPVRSTSPWNTWWHATSDSFIRLTQIQALFIWIWPGCQAPYPHCSMPWKLITMSISQQFQLIREMVCTPPNFLFDMIIWMDNTTSKRLGVRMVQLFSKSADLLDYGQFMIYTQFSREYWFTITIWI